MDDPVNAFFSAVDAEFGVSKGLYKTDKCNILFTTKSLPFEIEEDNEDYEEEIISYSGSIRDNGDKIVLDVEYENKKSIDSYEFIYIEFGDYL